MALNDLEVTRVDQFALLAAFVLTLFLYLKSKRRIAPLPPGPRKLPLLGNLLDFPTSFEWETYARWGKEYNSDVIHISVGGSELVILNSIKAASELLDRRSKIYSSRPHLTMVCELMGWSWVMSLLPYGQAWKERRTLFTKHFHASNVGIYRPVQLGFIYKMFLQILDKPEDFLSITQLTFEGMALALAYGLPIKKVDDPYIALAEEAIHTVGLAVVPGAFLVDAIPLLKYVPEWVPGAGFQKTAKHFRHVQETFRNMPFEHAVRNIAEGTGKPSLVSASLENMDENVNKAHYEEVVKDTAGMIYSAGADSVLSAVKTLFLAIVNYPEVQKKAQEELDRVLRGRLPSLDDEQDLPYLSAVVKEVLRWKPVTPIGVPHCTSEDDIYKGYHIPKGSIVVGNAWAMLNDDTVYPNPFEFKPDRFLTDDGKLDLTVQDPAHAAFGFGRRKCAGIHIALSSLFMTAATLLSSFHISKAIDEGGRPIEAEIKYRSGIICEPLPFKCLIKPRSSVAEGLLRSAAHSY